jgi:hypothetical protein
MKEVTYEIKLVAVCNKAMDIIRSHQMTGNIDRDLECMKSMKSRYIRLVASLKKYQEANMSVLECYS